MRPLFFVALTVALGVPAAAETADNGIASDRLICKKFLETGSLVKKRKQCMTKADWDRVSDSQREGSRRLIEDLTTKPAGGN